MVDGNPFRGLIRGGVLFVLLVVACVAFDVVVLVRHSNAAWALPAAVIGAVQALATHRYRQRSRQLLAGDYLVRWHDAQGEWQQFVIQEHSRSTRIALVFLSLMLGSAALLALLNQVAHDPFL